MGWHVPAGEENVPKEHVIVNDAEALYPLAQRGVHVDPLGVDAAQEEEYVVEGVLEGIGHGLGVHTAVGGVHTPVVWHVAEREPDDRYDVEPHAMLQVLPDG